MKTCYQKTLRLLTRWNCATRFPALALPPSIPGSRPDPDKGTDLSEGRLVLAGMLVQLTKDVRLDVHGVVVEILQ